MLVGVGAAPSPIKEVLVEKTEIEVRIGQCPVHEEVEATRELPTMRFPFIYYAVLRSRAKRKPFLCPYDGQPVKIY